MFRKAAVQCKEGTTVVLSICLANWLPDDDLVCCGDRVAGPGSVCEDGGSYGSVVTKILSKHTTQSVTLSHTAGPTTRDCPPALQGIPTQWWWLLTGEVRPRWRVTQSVSQSKTSRSVNVFLSNNGRKINEKFQHEEKFFRVFKLTLVCCLRPIKTKMSLNHFIWANNSTENVVCSILVLFLFRLSANSV